MTSSVISLKKCNDLQIFSGIPYEVFAIGNLEILSDEKTAFFCSSKVSGAAILKIFERANLWRKQQTTIIGGFHSPLEKEVLETLFRGKGRIIICPARSLEQMRLPNEWNIALDENRLLILSPFSDISRVSKKTAEKRNDFVAQIADRIVFGFISEGSKIEKLQKELIPTNKPCEIL